jgi:WD40 repeat protein
MCSATRTGEIKVREVATGRELWRDTAHRPENYDGRPTIRIFGVAFSPNDQFVATVGFIDGTVQLWNANTGEKLHEPLPARPSLTGVTFTPDSRRVVAVGYDSEVRIWDVTTGQLALTLSAPTGGRRGDIAYTARPYFSHRHQQLMVLDWSGTVAVWNGREYRERGEVAAEK